MASISKLSVAVSADGAQFKAGLDRAAKQAESWARQMKKVMADSPFGGTMGKIGMAGLGLSGVERIGKLVSGQFGVSHPFEMIDAGLQAGMDLLTNSAASKVRAMGKAFEDNVMFLKGDQGAAALAKSAESARAVAIRQVRDKHEAEMKAMMEARDGIAKLWNQYRVETRDQFQVATDEVKMFAAKAKMDMSAGTMAGKALDAISAAKFRQQQDAANGVLAMMTMRAGKFDSSKTDLGRSIMDKAQDFLSAKNANLTATSSFMGRGSAEEGSFKARFEQSQTGIQSTNQQILAAAQETAKQAASMNQKLAELGREAFKQKPPIVLSLGGA